MKKLVYFCLALLFSTSLYAQFGGEFKMPRPNIITGIVVDSVTNAPIPGAFVTMVNNMGSDHMATDAEGKFEHQIGNTGEIAVKVEVSCIGYKIFRKYYPAEETNVETGTIKMVIDKENIDEAIVKARRILFKSIGDTTVFFPSNLELPEGATILDALSLISGVEANEHSVEVLGKLVERTYVNGKAMFGEDDPMVALNNLDADLVAQVLAYDEYIEEEALTKGKHAEKRRVLNILTFDFVEESINLNATAGVGMDVDKNIDGKYRTRYVAAVSAGTYNENRQIMVDVRSHNALNLKNGLPVENMSFYGGDTYLQNHSASVKFNAKLSKIWKLSLSYSYDDAYTDQKTIRHDQYFDLATGGLDRVYYDTTMNNSRNKIHVGDFKVDREGKKHIARVYGQVSYRDNAVNDFSNNKVVMGDNIFSQISVDNKNRSESMGYSLYGSNTIKIKKMHGLVFEYNADFNNSDLKGDRVEDSLDRADNKYILSVRDYNNLYLKGSASYDINSDKAGMFSVGYGITYNRSGEHNLATDMNTGDIDSTLTRKMTQNNLQQLITLRYHYFGKDFHIIFDGFFKNTHLMRDDRFPEIIEWGKSYIAVQPSIDINYRPDILGTGQFQLIYNTFAEAPSLEQVSDKLMFTNPLFLSTGNPNLKQRYTHNFALNYIDINIKKQRQINISLRAKAINNVIGAKRIFYSEKEYLPEYSYTTEPGAILTTYDNIGTAYNASFSGSYSFPVGQLNTSFKVMYDFYNTPKYVGEKISEVIQHSPTLLLGLKSNIIDSPVQFYTDAKVSYFDSRSAVGISDKSIGSEIKLNVKADFLKRLYADLHCKYYIEHSFTQNLNRINDVRLNATLGCRLFKNRKGAVSITCNDILNSGSNFMNTISAERISNTWTSRNSRYVIVSFSYKFSKLK